MEIVRVTNAKLKKLVDKFEGSQWPKADLEHYGKIKPPKKYHRFIMREHGKIVGMAEVSIETNVACLEGLLVDETIRGQGIGTALLKKVEAFARTKGCTKIWLATGKDWKAASFYKKHGFEITAVLKEHVFNQDEVLMTKFLK
ncbi:MAG: GNAT family N-acetyltransferase [Candidatus Dojkabacteria bacterium]